jgi:phospholipid-binding lipoprotein MlaA
MIGTLSTFRTFARPRRIALSALLVACSLALAGCSTPPGGEGVVHDPYETQNRKVHDFNRAFDRTVVRPLSRGAGGDGEQSDLAIAAVNFADNLGAPQNAVNRLLQGELGLAGRNLWRFTVNTTLGFGGLFDVAADFGIEPDDTDFGETLYVWGVPEGAYQELPILGPSTERRTAGRVVDLFTNPLSSVLTHDERAYARAARITGRVLERGRYGGAVDSVLHESADSYAQSRLIYLQNRRFELSGGAASEADFTDPYEELYGE